MYLLKVRAMNIMNTMRSIMNIMITPDIKVKVTVLFYYSAFKQNRPT
jgi:hypothetical protein